MSKRAAPDDDDGGEAAAAANDAGSVRINVLGAGQEVGRSCVVISYM